MINQDCGLNRLRKDRPNLKRLLMPPFKRWPLRGVEEHNVFACWQGTSLEQRLLSLGPHQKYLRFTTLNHIEQSRFRIDTLITLNKSSEPKLSSRSYDTR